MKQIINGKMYNTETATEVASWWNGFSRRDFKFCEETLYLKRTGEFFLYGEGGAMSKYSESCGQNCWTGGSRIITVSINDAKQWAEKHLDADEYVSLFGEPEE